MRTRPWILATALAAAMSAAPPAWAETTVFTSAVAFNAALLSAGLSSLHEGFEDEAAWGAVRSSVTGGFVTSPAVTSQGLTWTSNFDAGEITTGEGAARSGQWGLYAYPHGSFLVGDDCHLPGRCGDGFAATADAGLLAIGGWIRTNTPLAGIALLLDGQPVDFDDDTVDTAYAFFGAISSTPFQRFEFRETEGTLEDAKFIFGDDFRFVLAPVPEPAAPLLWLAGLAGLAGWRRRAAARCA